MTDSERKLVSIFFEISNNRDKLKIDLETKISDLELDSLDVLDVILRIQNEFEADIPIVNFSICKDIMSVNNEIIKARK
jgi:acyl carrier protein